MDTIEKLIQKGAAIPNPNDITIGREVQLDRLSGKGVVLYPGTRLFGEKTYIAEGAKIGREAPVTIEDCYVGPEVELKGGYFNGAVFLKKASCGLGSHVRKGTILEEEASIAHTVGLKQTILLPYVTLGSLINFCDCLMAGGTSRKNHSEVGSSFIHFNFTPNQDKATPSLIGDVPLGVMLKQSPIFLGGQGGLVGPCRLAYGTVTAAGTIWRMDQLKKNHLVYGAKSGSGVLPYKTGSYIGLQRLLLNNFIYIVNLYALRQWYRHVRSLFVGPDLSAPLLDGLTLTLASAISERIKQLGRLAEKLSVLKTTDKIGAAFKDAWPAIEARFEALCDFMGDMGLRSQFVKVVTDRIQSNGNDYLDTISNLDDDQSETGTQWMQGIVDHVVSEVTGLISDW